MAGRAISTTPDVVVVDATYHLPTAKRDAEAEYEAAHIPGAVFFDIDTSPTPQSAAAHAAVAREFRGGDGAIGIGSDDLVVVYDSYGLMSAARAWWMFRVFGHDRVAVLDGGLPKWRAEGRPLESQAASRRRVRIPRRASGPSWCAPRTRSWATSKQGRSRCSTRAPPARFRGERAGAARGPARRAHPGQLQPAL